MKAPLGICLITQAQPLIEDVTFVIEQLQAGLPPAQNTGLSPRSASARKCSRSRR